MMTIKVVREFDAVFHEPRGGDEPTFELMAD